MPVKLIFNIPTSLLETHAIFLENSNQIRMYYFAVDHVSYALC